MTGRTVVHEEVIKALCSGQWKELGVHGFLVGRRLGLGLEVLSAAYCCTTDSKHVTEQAAQLAVLLPGGFDLLGLVLITDTDPSPETTASAAQQYVTNRFEEYFDQESLLICNLKKGATEVSEKNFTLLGEDVEVRETDVQVTSEDLFGGSVIVRLTAQVTVTIYMDSKTSWSQAVGHEMCRVVHSLSSDACVFKVKHSNVLLASENVKGMSAEQSCYQLYQYSLPSDETSTKSKKKAPKEQFSVSMEMLMMLSRDQTDIPSCSPVIQHNSGDYKATSLTLPVDVVAVVPGKEKIGSLYSILTKAVIRQFDAIRACLADCRKDDRLDTPEIFHFRPRDVGQMCVSIVYPRSHTDAQLESRREKLHTLFMLELDRPFFRRANNYRFPGDATSEGYLLNPHASLSTAGQVGVQYLVKGTYSYHHYMQDRFDDNQWGCAYRSLQTLVSWFRFQGYTDKPIPSHREIQQALVDIGDKEKSFVGSRKWIGSLEVGFCLDQLIGVTCKILNVSSGADLASKGRELSSHFQAQGTPIMIGGGVLAHTILGVDFDDVTGNIRFLILDPHYTGSEDLKVVLDKGWCGWKGPDFWDAKAHYNLCMPQRPKVK